MAWSTPPTKSAGNAVAATDWNALANDISFLGAARGAYVGTSQTTTSTTYTALTTAGPSVTVTTGTSALVWVGATMNNTTVGNYTLMSYAVTGSSSIAASDDRAFYRGQPDASIDLSAGLLTLITGLTAGSNTFTALYRVTAGTGTWYRRTIAVIPLTA